VSYRNLLIGCGVDHRKKLYPQSEGAVWKGELVKIDMNPTCGADVVWDMEKRPLPFGDAEFDEIHAYDCLEHWGRQGDWRGWFDEMAEYHRLLKPGGKMSIVVPMGADYFADPGHTRFFEPNYFRFLNQAWYDECLAKKMPMTDYRWYWKLDFKIEDLQEIGKPIHHLAAVLRK
jgi:SAM-dependent methyltransferase